MMTISNFAQELKGHWSWLYEQYNQHLARLYTREWASWELLTIAGVLSILLVLKIRRRRRKMAASIVRLARGAEEAIFVGVRPPGGNGYRRNVEDVSEYIPAEDQESDTGQDQLEGGIEIVALSDQPVRHLRREIIKRDRTEARLAREVAELTTANKRLQKEVAESMRAEERLERKFLELTAANERLQRQMRASERTAQAASA